jgi:hypothetical protein
MKQQTAVEWLEDNLIGNPFSEKDFAHNVNVFKQAKEMEEKQTVNFANDFYDDCVTDGGSLNQSAEEYYKQTYNKNDN